MKNRLLEPIVEELAFGDRKIALVSGPRQCGKTTLAKMLLDKRGNGRYLNWDETKFRRQWAKDPAGIVPEAILSKTPLVVLDEIHKDRLWKRKIKGVYDTLETPCDILVTGSARLNVYRRGSDSLMGRYIHFRLHPFTLIELIGRKEIGPERLRESIGTRSIRRSKVGESAIADMMELGPFPEPLTRGSSRKAKIWRRTREQLVIREDLRDLSRLQDLAHVELMTSLLPSKVGSQFSVKGMREDLEVSFDTVKRWMTYLKELYYVFEIKPWSKKIPRSLRRDGKVYLLDFGIVEDEPARFENLIAFHLLKACQSWTDRGEGTYDLYYLRNKEKKEIDFLITQNGVPWLPIEVKLNNGTPSPNWKAFMPHIHCSFGLQVVREPHYKPHSFENYDILVIGAAEMLNYFG